MNLYTSNYHWTSLLFSFLVKKYYCCLILQNWAVILQQELPNMWILESTLPSTGQHRRSAMKAKHIIPLLFLIPQCVCLLSFITAPQLLPGSTTTTYGIGGREREWEKKDTWIKSISPDMIAVICPCYSYWCRSCGCILHWHVTSKTKEDK